MHIREIFKKVNVCLQVSSVHYNKYKLTVSLKSDLVVWVLWHINLCRLFNAKSIFIQINSSISNISVKYKYTVQLSKTFLFQAIQFSQTVLIKTIQFSIGRVFVYT